MRQVRKYALLFGSGAISAIVAMEYKLLTFPDGAKIYMGYFFSFIAIAGIFLTGGITLLKILDSTNEIVKKINEAKKDIKDEAE